MIENETLHGLLVELKKRIINSEKWYAFLLPKSKKSYLKRFGICGNLAKLYNSVGICEALRPHFESWEHYSGDPYYPVPAMDWATPNLEFNANWNMWLRDSVYCSYRYDLLDHLIESTKD